MKKNNIFQSPVIASSGLMGFVGEGYRYQKILKFLLPILYSFRWITFQAKTITAWKNLGNMGLKKDGITPVLFHPHCIYVNFWRGYAVNNVSLSNSGIEAILELGVLQKIKGELHLSFMPTLKDSRGRLIEISFFVAVLKPQLKKFKSKKVFLHFNVSCPNVEHGAHENLFDNLKKECIFLNQLNIPIILKVGWNFPVDIILKLQKLNMIFGVDAINTIAFDELPGFTKKKYFKRDKDGNFISPLDKYQDLFYVKGRGGVSGNPIRPYALKWIREAREDGVKLPIIGGGGILWPWHVYQFKKAGATAISPGSLTFLRPFNLLIITLSALLFFRKH